MDAKVGQEVHSLKGPTTISKVEVKLQQEVYIVHPISGIPFYVTGEQELLWEEQRISKRERPEKFFPARTTYHNKASKSVKFVNLESNVSEEHGPVLKSLSEVMSLPLKHRQTFQAQVQQ